MTEKKRCVAVGFLTEEKFRRFGRDLQQVFVVPADHGFDDLLRRLQDAREHL